MALKQEIKYRVDTTNEPEIVFSYNTADKTNDVALFRRMIELLSINTNKAIFEIVVNDNGTTETSLKIVAI